MSELIQTLSTLLPNICNQGHFFATGRVEMFAPSVAVDGVGTIALPLLAEQADRLIAQSEQAPYGRGEETLLNTDVRRTWQIDASKIHIGGKHWEKTLSTIVQQAAQGLGVQEPVNAELYKMLVYETGSFFVEYRDTEKAPRMFATLIVVLPYQYEGGL